MDQTYKITEGYRNWQAFVNEFRTLEESLKESRKTQRALILRCNQLKSELVISGNKLKTVMRIRAEDEKTMALLRKECDRAVRTSTEAQQKEKEAQALVARLQVDTEGLQAQVGVLQSALWLERERADMAAGGDPVSPSPSGFHPANAKGRQQPPATSTILPPSTSGAGPAAAAVAAAGSAKAMGEGHTKYVGMAGGGSSSAVRTSGIWARAVDRGLRARSNNSSTRGGGLFDSGEKRRQRHALMARGGGHVNSSSDALKHGSPSSRLHHRGEGGATTISGPPTTPCSADGGATGGGVACRKNGLFSRRAEASPAPAALGKEAPGRERQQQHAEGSIRGWPLGLEPERSGNGARQQLYGDDDSFTWGTGEMEEDLFDSRDDFGGKACHSHGGGDFMDNDGKNSRGGGGEMARVGRATSTPFQKWKHERGIWTPGVAETFDNQAGYDLWGS